MLLLLGPGRLWAEELFSVGIGGDEREGEVVIFRRREGVWEEESFPPAGEFDGNFSPALGLSPAGEVWAAWAARRDGGKPKIYYSRKRGDTWTEPRRVTAGEEYWEMTPALAFGPEGTLLAAWAGERDEETGIYCARWEGGGFGPAARVSPAGRSPNLNPALAIDPAGQALLAWQGWEEGYYRIFTAFFDGREWAAGRPPARREGIDQVLPSAFSPGKRGWGCSWFEAGRLFSTEGDERGWSAPEKARTVTGDGLSPAGEPRLTGWAAGRDQEGKSQVLRVGVTFKPGTFVPAKSVPGDRVFVGYGDSITYGTDGPPPGKSYIPLLKSDLEAAHSAAYAIHNEGYPNATTLDLLSGPGHRDWPCPGIETVLGHYNASRILIMAGTNDYRVHPSISKTHLGAMIDRARNAGYEPILATILPADERRRPLEWITELNRDYIAPLAREKGCSLADPFQAYLDYGNWRELLVADGVHPVWPEGSRVIADAWFAALSNPDPAPATVDSGDYTGDGTAEIALFHPAAGLWAIRGATRVYFGTTGDIPVSGDYDGDGTTDLAVFRAAAGLWAVRGVTRTYFGKSGDLPLPGDYRGDGFCLPAIFREATGLWAVRGLTRIYFGAPGDIPVPGYYRENGPKEIAVFRPATGLWAVRGLTRFNFGRDGDRPIPAAYGSSGGPDRPAVFRPASGAWIVRRVSRFYFGGPEDRTVPAPYSGGETIGAVFRESSGLWALRGTSRVYFGAAGYLPVTGRLPRPVPAAAAGLPAAGHFSRGGGEAGRESSAIRR